MTTDEKLAILSDAAKYDVACTSSGVTRGGKKGSIGNASPAGCCHSFSADGRCVTLLKVLMSNACSYECAYCVNRRSNDTPRATFSPREGPFLVVLLRPPPKKSLKISPKSPKPPNPPKPSKP